MKDWLSRLWAHAHKSATIIWNGICAFVLGLVTFADQFVTNPEAKQVLTAIFKPTVVAVIWLVMIVGSIFSRMRTLGK